MTKRIIGVLLVAIVTLFVASPVAQHPMRHADMAHMPDFEHDPDGPTHVVTGTETLSGQQTLWNIVVKAGGTLKCDPSLDLKFVTLQVLEGGTFDCQIDGPRFTVRDVPLNTTFDPDQFGHGWLCFGKCYSNATPKLEWTRLSVELFKGDQTIRLGVPAQGWRLGDTLGFIDTHPCTTDDKINFSVPGVPEGTTALPKCKENWTEERKIAQISPDGKTIGLDRALDWDHPAPRDKWGNFVEDDAGILMPLVSNNTRGIVWRSENPAGVRGHTMFSMRADVNVSYNQFDDLGRTCDEQIDSTRWVDGQPVHIGTCQGGKYAGHYHHLIGPKGGPAPTVKGNVYNRPLKWGFSVHDSHYTRVLRNVVNSPIGAGYVTETGQETENLFDGNLAYNVLGSNFTKEVDDISQAAISNGLGGDCFWIGGINNRWVNNSCGNARRRGYNIIQGNSSGKVLRCSKGQGMDPTLPDEGYDCIPDRMEPLQLDGNESIAAGNTGMFIYTVGKNDQTTGLPRPLTINGLRLWHNLEGFRVGNADSVIINNPAIIGYCGANTYRELGIQIDQNHDLKVTRPRIDCVRLGVASLLPGYADLTPPNTVAIEGPGFIRAEISVNVSRDTHNQPHDGQSTGTVTLRNVEVSCDPTAGGPVYCYYFWQTLMDGMNVTKAWTWKNYGVSFNGAPPADSEVFSPEQGPDVIMPPTTAPGETWTNPDNGITYSQLRGCPTPGLTNAQCFAQFGVAYGGKVSCPWPQQQVDAARESLRRELDHEPSMAEVAARVQRDQKVYGYLCAQNTPPPPTCTFSIAPTSATIAASGGTASVTVTASDATCGWTVTGLPAWVTSVPMAGTGSRSVTLTAAPNTVTSQRSTSVSITGLPFSLTQAAAPAPTVQTCTGVLVGTSTAGAPVVQTGVRWTDDKGQPCREK